MYCIIGCSVDIYIYTYSRKFAGRYDVTNMIHSYLVYKIRPLNFENSYICFCTGESSNSWVAINNVTVEFRFENLLRFTTFLYLCQIVNEQNVNCFTSDSRFLANEPSFRKIKITGTKINGRSFIDLFSKIIIKCNKW